jgi:hypothetical protein
MAWPSYIIKWKIKKYHSVRTILKSNRKIVERGKMDTPSTQIRYLWLSWLGTGTSIKKNVAVLTKSPILLNCRTCIRLFYLKYWIHFTSVWYTSNYNYKINDRHLGHVESQWKCEILTICTTIIINFPTLSFYLFRF